MKSKKHDDACESKKTRHSSLNDSGIIALLYAVSEQAVEDVRQLQERGMIVNGHTPNIWPKVNGCRVIYGHDYEKRSQVNELVGFFKDGHFQHLLKIVGSKISAKVSMQRLHLT